MKRTTTPASVWPAHPLPEPEQGPSWLSLACSWVSIRRLPGHTGRCAPKRTAWIASAGGVVAAGALILLMVGTALAQPARSNTVVGWPLGTTHALVGDAHPTIWLMANAKSQATPSAPASQRHVVCQPKSGHGPEMVMIAPGSFQQGSPETETGRDSYESPQHAVTIPSPFAIGRCEVTVGQFRQFVEASKYETDAEKGDGCYVYDEQQKQWKQDANRHWRNTGFKQDDPHPVTCVSWQDAQAYIQWLNGWLGLEGKWVYRLPTESEWEFATRAGTTSAYYWGNDSQCSYANGLDRTAQETGKFQADLIYADCPDGYVFTSPVGSFSPNRWGLYDISGNVWEWVQDCYVDSYEGAPEGGLARKASKGTSCEFRSLRGGGWNSYPRYLRSAIRDRGRPGGADVYTGFRLARTP